MTNSSILFHTITICNMPEKMGKMEFAQKFPGDAQILEGVISREPIFSGPEIFRDGSSHYFLQILKFSART